MWEGIFFGLLGGGLGMVLTLMGVKMDTDALKETMVKSRSKIANIFGLHYILSPLCAICTSKILNLDHTRTLALYIISITPPTVAASVVTFAVGGNVELATSSSIFVLISSFFTMPLIFSLMITTSLRGSSVRKIKVPYDRMSGVLAFFVLCKAVGILIQKKVSEATKKRIILCLKYSSITIMVSAMGVYFIFCKELVKATFYFGKSWEQHYFGCVIFLFLYTSFTVASCLKDVEDRDAIIITALRKNPGITLSVGSLSLARLETEEYNKAMGMLLAYSIILDWCGLPVIIALRKLRKGYYCWKKEVIVVEV